MLISGVEEEGIVTSVWFYLLYDYPFNLRILVWRKGKKHQDFSLGEENVEVILSLLHRYYNKDFDFRNLGFEPV